jgi:hypothetical protein
MSGSLLSLASLITGASMDFSHLMEPSCKHHIVCLKKISPFHEIGLVALVCSCRDPHISEGAACRRQREVIDAEWGDRNLESPCVLNV